VPFLPALFTRNWKLKLAALILAMLLWTSLRVEAMDRQSLPSVPVRVQLNDPRWAQVAEPDPTTVTVDFSGPARELFSLRMDRPTVMVPVDEVSSADTSVLIRAEWVRLPDRPGVTVEAVEPRSVRLAFEPITQAAVPLALRLRGSLPESLALVEPVTASPDFVRVSGPASQVQALDSVPLRPVDLSGLEASETRRVPVDTTGLSGAVISPGNVRVTFALEERVEQSIPGIPVVPPDGGRAVTVEPEEMSVTVSGARSRVRELNSSVLRVEVVEGTPIPPAGDTVRVPVGVRGLPDLLDARPGQDSISMFVAPPPGP